MMDPTLAGTKLDRYFHVCAFFNSRDEEYGVMTPFYKETEEQGEQMLHIVPPQYKKDHETRLEAGGVNARKCISCRQLRILGWDEAYLSDGAFDQDRMLGAVEAIFAAGRNSGFARMRIMGNMNWALAGDVPGSDQLLEYETRVNEVLVRNRQPAICVYDMSKLSAQMMMDVLRTHPMTLVGGAVHENPFYTPAEKMLPELRARRVQRAPH